MRAAAGPDRESAVDWRRVEAIVRAVAEEFGLGEVLAVDRPEHGSISNWFVTTSEGTFFLKSFDEEWRVELLDVVQAELNRRGVRQSRLFRTTRGSLLGDTGYAVQERLPGAVVPAPSERQCRSVFSHLARYLTALADLPIPAEVDAEDSLWTRTASAPWLTANLPDLLRRQVSVAGSAAGVTALSEVLAGALPSINKLSIQLVHGDIGWDNVLLDGDEVVAVVDFTPYHESQLFALSTALYWYHVYGTFESADLVGMRASLESFGAIRPFTAEELAVLPAMLVREALRRLAIPLALAQAKGGEPGKGLRDRLGAALSLARCLPALQSQLVPSLEGTAR